KGVAHLQLRVGEKRAAVDKRWQGWLDRRLLPPDEAKSMMTRFVDRNLEPIPLPESKEAWTAGRDALRRKVLEELGIDDLVPARWELNIQEKGTIRREGYRIEKITFESYPGMAVPALLYVPDGLKERAPGIVSITGHTYEQSK